MSTQDEIHVFGANRRTEKWGTWTEMVVPYYLEQNGGPGGVVCCGYYATLVPEPWGLHEWVKITAPDLMAARRLGSEAVEKVLVENGWLSPKEESNAV